MTQEEKAKAYDEALKIAKKNYVTAQDLCEGSQIGIEYFKNTLENIFPELKESEDEKIKKEIIEYIKTGTYHKKWVTWLEKQGNKPQGKSALEAIREEKVDNANKIEPKDYSSIDTHFGKPIDNDKVGPKFKVGDWITNGDYTWEVISVDDFDYTLQNQWGTCAEDTIDYVDEVFRLFQKN